MIDGAPSVFVPRRNPLWWPAFVDRQGHRLHRLDDIAGKPLDPTEYAALLEEIRQAGVRASTLRAGSGLRVGVGDGTFSPLDGGGVAAWFDMQDATSYTVTTGAISAIVNKATNVAWTEATAGNRPAYAATLFNGFPCMDLNGTTHRIVSSESTVVACMSKRARAILYVAKHDVADTVNAVFGYGNSAELTKSSGHYGVTTTSTGRWVNLRSNTLDISTIIESTGASDILPHLFEWIDTSSVTSLVVDGGTPDPDGPAGPIHSGTWGDVAPDRCAIGINPRNPMNYPLNGRIAEIILHAGEPTSSARELERAYLAAKWSITLL